MAGIPGAVSSVPDGMASAVLVGVNPIHGLYASVLGPIAGGLTSSTRLMVITTTSASALAAGSAISGVGAEDRVDALFLVTALAGAAMVLAGILKFGRYTRFVSVSVMTGFLTGVAANIIFGQLPDLTGTTVDGAWRSRSVPRGDAPRRDRRGIARDRPPRPRAGGAAGRTRLARSARWSRSPCRPC